MSQKTLGLYFTHLARSPVGEFFYYQIWNF